MKKSDFYYDLPEELIAQHPLEPRNSSRMLSVDRESGACEHLHFYDLTKQLRAGDLLVLNDSRVLPARLYGEKEGTGSFVEFLLLSQHGDRSGKSSAAPEKNASPALAFRSETDDLLPKFSKSRKTGTVS